MSDTRIPVLFGYAAPGDAVLAEGDAPTMDGAYTVRFTLPPALGHVAGCACCAPRGPAATALATLFRARATGEAPYFSRVAVLATPAGIKAVREALEGDVVSGARFFTAAAPAAMPD